MVLTVPPAVYSPLGSNQSKTLIKVQTRTYITIITLLIILGLEDFTNLISSLVIKGWVGVGSHHMGIESKEQSHERFSWHFFWP